MDTKHAFLLQNYQNKIYAVSWTKLNIFLDNFIFLNSGWKFLELSKPISFSRFPFYNHLWIEIWETFASAFILNALTFWTNLYKKVLR